MTGKHGVNKVTFLTGTKTNEEPQLFSKIICLTKNLLEQSLILTVPAHVLWALISGELYRSSFHATLPWKSLPEAKSVKKKCWPISKFSTKVVKTRVFSGMWLIRPLSLWLENRVSWKHNSCIWLWTRYVNKWRYKLHLMKKLERFRNTSKTIKPLILASFTTL